MDPRLFLTPSLNHEGEFTLLKMRFSEKFSRQLSPIFVIKQTCYAVWAKARFLAAIMWTVPANQCVSVRILIISELLAKQAGMDYLIVIKTVTLTSYHVHWLVGGSTVNYLWRSFRLVVTVWQNDIETVLSLLHMSFHKPVGYVDTCHSLTSTFQWTKTCHFNYAKVLLAP